MGGEKDDEEMKEPAAPPVPPETEPEAENPNTAEPKDESKTEE